MVAHDRTLLEVLGSNSSLDHAHPQKSVLLELPSHVAGDVRRHNLIVHFIDQVLEVDKSPGALSAHGPYWL